MVYMLQEKWIPESSYGFICQADNFIYLNGQNVLYPKTAEIVFQYWRGTNGYRKFLPHALDNHLCGFFILHCKEWYNEKEKKKESAGKNAEVYAKQKG